MFESTESFEWSLLSHTLGLPFRLTPIIYSDGVKGPWKASIVLNPQNDALSKEKDSGNVKFFISESLTGIY